MDPSATKINMTAMKSRFLPPLTPSWRDSSGIATLSCRRRSSREIAMTPVMLAHVSGHAIYVNAAALRAAGITANNAYAIFEERELGRSGELFAPMPQFNHVE